MLVEYFCGLTATRGTMASMTRRIDPTVMRVWRTPHSVQYGIDPPRAILTGVTTGHERMLDALIVGTDTAGLRAIADQYGLTHREVDELHRAIAPVLVDVDPPPAPRPHRVTLVGTTPTAHELARLLRSEGVKVAHVGDADHVSATRADLGIAVGHYVLDPRLHSAWLRHDTPHLPVVWSDTGARIGPLIEPGRGPCLHCLERHRTDSDPAWPVIASQLLDFADAAETPLLVADAAVLATRIALTRLRGRAADVDAIATTITANGDRTTQAWEKHPECGCHSLADVLTLPVAGSPSRSVTKPRARKGTGTARAPRAARTATTTRAGADAPA